MRKHLLAASFSEGLEKLAMSLGCVATNQIVTFEQVR